MPRDLVILRGSDRLRWGGDLRRRFLFQALEGRPRTTVVEGFGRADIRAAMGPYRRRRWEVWRRGPEVLSTELLDPGLLDLVRRVGVARAVDIHDEPLLQAAALGITLPPEQADEVRARLDANMAAFRRLVVPAASFGRLVGIDPDCMIVASNGTDSTSIRPMPRPDRPTVGFVSGAAPGRGIELLVEAARLAREPQPDLRLLLLLVTTGEASEAYLASLREATAADPWVEIGTAPHELLSEELGRTSVLCVPHPPNDYMDVALPVKLFDGMAAGRPTVITPRTEMRAVLEADEAGVVAAGDRAEDLAAALVRVLADPAGARRMGENARRAAENRHDWRVISAKLAADLGLAG